MHPVYLVVDVLDHITQASSDLYSGNSVCSLSAANPAAAVVEMAMC